MMEAGGASGESIEAGYLKPFTEKTGIKVVRESPWSLGKIRGMVETGVITAAIVELDSLAMEQAKALDLLEPLDWNAIDPDPIFDEARQEKRSEEHTSELQSLMRISYAVFCLKKKKQ